MADAADLKSAGRETVWVRLPPALPKMARHSASLFYLWLLVYWCMGDCLCSS